MLNFFSKFTAVEAAGISQVGVLVIDVVLVAVLIICAITDARTNKILNVVTFPAMLAGLVLNTLFGFLAGTGFNGLLWALIGWAVGMGIQWVPFMFGLAKAGDVKLLAAVGALKGWAFCTFGFVYGAAAFGFIILPWLAKRGELKMVGNNIKQYLSIGALTRTVPDAPAPTVTKKFVPWGVGLSIGFGIALVIELIFGRPIWVKLW